MSETAFVGRTLDNGLLDLARVQEPVGKKKDCRNAEGHDHEDRHGEGGVENFNIAHSDPKDSKKVFATSIPFCKLYLVYHEEKSTFS